MHDLVQLKGLLCVTVALLGLGSVLTPRYCLLGHHNKSISSSTPDWLFAWGNMMASGVLLAAGLVHQLADSAAVLNTTTSTDTAANSNNDDFPWAMFVAGLTFIGFMVLEESIHLLTAPGSSDDDMNDTAAERNPLLLLHSHSHHHHHRQDEDTDDLHASNYGASSSTPPTAMPDTNKNPPQEKHLIPPNPSKSCSIRLHSSSSSCRSRHGSSCRDHDSHDHDSNDYRHDDDQDTINHDHHHHHHDEHIDLHLHGSFLATFVLLMALVIHSVMAGVGVGIATNPQALTGTAAAIVAHKAFEGFTLGSNLVTTSITQQHQAFFWMAALGFSFATPLGIVLGQVLLILKKEQDDKGGTDHDNGTVMVAVVQAMVAGTFLYISIVEIGTKELLACRQEPHSTPSRRLIVEALKLAWFLAGFLAMSALAVFV